MGNTNARTFPNHLKRGHSYVRCHLNPLTVPLVPPGLIPGVLLLGLYRETSKHTHTYTCTESGTCLVKVYINTLLMVVVVVVVVALW